MFQFPGWYSGASAAWHGGHAGLGGHGHGHGNGHGSSRRCASGAAVARRGRRRRRERLRMQLRGPLDLGRHVLQHFGLQQFLRDRGAQQPLFEIARFVHHVDVVAAAVDDAFVHVQVHRRAAARAHPAERKAAVPQPAQRSGRLRERRPLQARRFGFERGGVLIGDDPRRVRPAGKDVQRHGNGHEDLLKHPARKTSGPRWYSLPEQA